MLLAQTQKLYSHLATINLSFYAILCVHTANSFHTRTPKQAGKEAYSMC